MKRQWLLVMALLAGILLLADGPGSAQDKAMLPDVDGVVWMRSSSEAKRAFLYGAGSAFVLEYYIRTKHNEQPSQFILGWVEVFGNRTWGELEKALDDYYAANPDQMQEHVFRVIWTQMIEPKMKRVEARP
ncbi:hypothetical protein [Fundidesulfovibrio terrae]|uniref:hypothetical protein n=1 Tax=Fundidesulfovibrio terrae TaxID=2922866 RepID=UPI001FAEE02E|nr:hypothetical protein [Fundidesulfovibrio terrae]